MTTWNPRANELFLKALELRSSDERQEFLDSSCAGDTALRAEVEALLEASDKAGSFLQFSAPLPGASIDASAPAERPGTLIGPYKLLQQLGEGGMGTVFMAEQTHPVQRKVALKVIKLGMDTRQVIARFEAERQALAMMDHVNIARVLDAGATETGRPYFVMELVHGMPITKYCDDNHLTPRERLELFVPVCHAIQHAHQKGIIHRDIKPSNVMITLYDGKPVPKLIDFGVAKATEQKLTERTLYTQYGTMVGTLEYMSPEQAEMSALGIDTRSDIYSLGVLLYELLTGGTPLSQKRIKEAAHAEIIRMIKEEDPPKPSTRLSDSGEALASISANRQMEPAKLTRLVRGELDWIVMKCLEKDRNRRYETANGFAMDVQRYLADEPVQACPPSAGYRVRKFVWRNKPLSASLAAAALSVAIGVVVVAFKNAELADKNSALAQAANHALELRFEASARADEANHLKDEAVAQGRELRVRGLIQDLAAFEALDDSLDYARRQTRPAHEWWLERAQLLIDGCQEDPAKGQRWKPGLSDVDALLVKLRAQARDATEQEQIADRNSHPRAKELAEKRGELQWLSRMLGLEPWPSTAEVEAQLAKEATPTEPSRLNSAAWSLVDPDAPVFGQEVKSLLLARRAVALASKAERALHRTTLAWALFRVGRFDEALAEQISAAPEIVGDRKAGFELQLARMNRTFGAWRSEAASQARRAERDALPAQLDALEREVQAHRTWRFADSENEWWNDQLTRLSVDLRRLKDRIAVAQRSVTSPEALRLWEAAIAAIVASPKYGGLKITPQIGLLPIGADSESALWEFADLQSGEPVQRGTDGKLILKPEMGVVYVLLPGGRVPVELVEPGWSELQDADLTKIELAPFFLSKYEMTMEQWTRVSHQASRPRYESLEMIPARAVSWNDCVASLSRVDAWVCLPTEAQWEYGCRAGTRSPWWTGTAKESLKGAANIDFDTTDLAIPTLQPVGQLRANGFGLHDMHGNIWEWCRNGFGTDDEVSGRGGNGEREWPRASNQVYCGGSFDRFAGHVRSSYRYYGGRGLQLFSLGLRPAKGLTP